MDGVFQRGLNWPTGRQVARASLVTLPLALAACHPAVLSPRGPVADAERTLLFDSLAIMLAIIVPTIIAVLAFGWWFRASNKRAKYLPDWAFSGRVELVVWGVPLLTIMLLGGVTWVASHELDPAKPLASKTPALEVQVVSLDWKWLFIYPNQHVASVNYSVIPAGIPVHFTLTSASVMNSFFVPQLGSMIYTMNHMANELYLQADKPGIFYGLATHFSGDGFSDMNFKMRAVPQDQFAAWVNTTQQAGDTLDDPAYRALSKQSIEPKPFTYRDVSPGLFARVVDQTLPPGPGPAPEPAPKTNQVTEK